MGAHDQSRSVALAYIDAVGRRDFDRIVELLHPDVEFVTAGPPIRGQQAFVAALRRLAPILVRTDVRATIADGNEVAVFYDFVSDTPAGAIQTIEWITTVEGRIRTSRLIFDKEHWPAAVAELASRSTIAA
jgi:ketosteroid isomerase-like protein